MNNNDKKKRVMRKASKLFVSLGITSVILIVATYAWFIGTLQVTVTGIEIQIETKEGLTISLDGQSWSNEVVVTKEAVTTELESIYPTNTNSWVSEENHEGMVPVSTVGKLDTEHSILEFYNKFGLTAIKGGYRVTTNKIENYHTEGEDDIVEESGEYVVFDIFIKNTSGDGYNVTYDAAEDEGIYLISDSYAKIVLNDNNEAIGDGIQNSARVGMFNIGRVGLDAELSAIQGISCTGGGSGDNVVTGLCNLGEDTTLSSSGEAPRGQGITWNIYEPNDRSHVEDSIQRFEDLCRLKSVNPSTHKIVYSNDNCDTINDGDYTYTYAVHTPIAAEDLVNIFDGLNSYTDDIYVFNPSSPSYTYGDKKLTKMEYYKDSDIFDDDENTRHEILRLAPNSITKMRIYIWLEGQDVDNFDIDNHDEEGNAQDVKVKFQFGFTKDRFAYLNENSTENISSTSSYLDKAKLQNFITNNSPTEIYFTKDGHSDGTNVSNDESEPIYAWMEGTKMYVSASDANKKIKLPANSSGLFEVTDCAAIVNVGKIDVTYLDVSEVTNMSFMFAGVGENTTTFNLDLSKWDTSNVTNMESMFYSAGQNATTFSIKIPNKNSNTTALLNGNGVSAPPPEGRTFTLVN